MGFAVLLVQLLVSSVLVSAQIFPDHNGPHPLPPSMPPSAIVRLTCKNTKYKLVVHGKTDKNGYFFMEAPKTVTSYAAHKCTVSIVSSPLAKCNKPTNLHGGLKGAVLRPEKPYLSKKTPFMLYTVGPLAFEPKSKCY
ncbi:Pollen Ole e 1 allergen/extensin [Corchorus olitorius]|uniref:Pollen Ole e 1 allergen/extensin n=1 Tax=Corchorus olitorius TaxID=93759 RepID=A0A1R3H4R6_9ROSI|nr:Pollen Ole e 1 allergen/extensin [Corchorus olitorius]